MKEAVVALVSLLFTSVTLTAVMFVAWRCFGRPRHALTWSIMFGLRTLTWAVNLVGRMQDQAAWSYYMPFVDLLSVTSAWLLAAGFVQRAEAKPTALRWLGVVGAAAIALSLAGDAMGNEALSRAPIFAINALAVALAMRHVWVPHLLKRPTDALVFIMLLFVAIYLAVTTYSAATLPPGEALKQVTGFRLLLLLGVPASAIVIGAVCIFLIASDLASQMRTLALSDPLTGVFNRRGLEQAAEPLIAAAQRQGRPVAIVIADLDRFKQVNDRFGHAAGDALLKAFADHAKQTLRRSDLFGRTGGEEFAFVLPNATEAQAHEVMERLRAGMAALTPERLTPFTLSASFGVAALVPGDVTMAAPLARADGALYAAKSEGRDRVVIAVRPSGATPEPDPVFG